MLFLFFICLFIYINIQVRYFLTILKIACRFRYATAFTCATPCWFSSSTPLDGARLFGREYQKMKNCNAKISKIYPKVTNYLYFLCNRYGLTPRFFALRFILWGSKSKYSSNQQFKVSRKIHKLAQVFTD